MNKFLVALCITVLTSGVQAAPIFSDNFDTDPLLLNTIPAGWTVSAGTVDTIGSPGSFDLLPGHGRYIDLDGSSHNAGILSRSLSLVGGTIYVASFDLAGSQRGDTNTVTVLFGSATSAFTRVSSNPFATFSMTFTPSTTGSYVLSFENNGGDNLGALLDNVKVESVAAPVPEPETYAMLLAGLGLLGFSARRRKRKSA